jgi:F0F1-type ATP synthase delta subunit
MISRAQVASYVAARLPSERQPALKQAAAWLIESGRANQARYLARDIAGVLARQGYVLARVEGARPLSRSAVNEIQSFVTSQTGAREIELESVLNPALVGGVKIETPGRELDASVKRKLAKFVEGVNA